MEQVIEEVLVYAQRMPEDKVLSLRDYARFLSEGSDELDDFDYQLLENARGYDRVNTVSFEEVLAEAGMSDEDL